MTQEVGSSHWWLRDRQSVPCAIIVDAINQPSLIAPEERLKVATRRLVFRVAEGKTAIVVKAFPLQGWRRWTARQAYAKQECQHLLTAELLGMSVPACLAYGERPFWGGLAWNTAVLEHIPSPTLRDIWIADSHTIDADAALERITPLAVRLYETGCNHIDFGPHAIMQRDAGEDCMIDWQYASFLDKPNPYVFASQIGYFGWATATNRTWLTTERVSQWFDHLWDSQQFPERTACRAIFEKTLAKRHSIKDRLNAASTFAP